MDHNNLMNTLVQAKKIYSLLNEVYDISLQLAEATSRQDNVTIQMLLSMRQEPLNLLSETDQALRILVGEIPAPDGERFRRLLDGEAPAAAEEEPLATQIASNRRLLQKVVDVDRHINQKLTGDKSFYAASPSA